MTLTPLTSTESDQDKGKVNENRGGVEIITTDSMKEKRNTDKQGRRKQGDLGRKVWRSGSRDQKNKTVQSGTTVGRWVPKLL